MIFFIISCCKGADLMQTVPEKFETLTLSENSLFKLMFVLLLYWSSLTQLPIHA